MCVLRNSRFWLKKGRVLRDTLRRKWCKFSLIKTFSSLTFVTTGMIKSMLNCVLTALLLQILQYNGVRDCLTWANMHNLDHQWDRILEWSESNFTEKSILLWNISYFNFEEIEKITVWENFDIRFIFTEHGGHTRLCQGVWLSCIEDKKKNYIYIISASSCTFPGNICT